jgi:hypothetical protein
MNYRVDVEHFFDLESRRFDLFLEIRAVISPKMMRIQMYKNWAAGRGSDPPA